MMIGTLRRALVLAQRPARSAMPDWPGSIQSSSDQVGQGVADELARLLGVAGAQHVVAGVLQVDGDQLLDRRLVFDDEDVGGHARSLDDSQRRIYGRSVTVL